MKKLLILFTIVFLTACGLQIRDAGTTTGNNPNTNGEGNFTVGGHASGIPFHKDVTLSINNHNYTIGSNGTFTFPQHFTSGTAYNVDVETNLGGAYTCSLQNDTGTIANANVTNVLLDCSCQVGSLGTGTGSAADPILVYTSTQLNGVAVSGSVADFDKNYKQVCDLDYAGMAPTPLGKSSKPFTGLYDGNNFFVLNYSSNETVASTEHRKGLFGWVYHAKLQNVNLYNVSLKADPGMGSFATPGRMGSLVGTADESAIENVYGEKITVNDNGQYFHGMGGIIGNQTTTTVGHGSCTSGTTCTVDCLRKVQAKNVDLIGGASQKVGGILGWTQVDANMLEVNDVHVHSCTKKCGGVVGMFWNDSRFNDINAQNVTVEGNERVGGIAGESEGKLERAASVGTVNGLTIAGGFGGIVGYTLREIQKSYTTTDVLSIPGVSTTPGTSNAGRVYGLSAIISNVAYDSSKTCQNCTANPGTQSRSNADSFKDGTDSVMSAWNFSTTWCLVNSDFPHLVDVPFSRCQ